MENIPVKTAPRKLRKIKRPVQRAQVRPVSFGTPTKVNFAQIQQQESSQPQVQNTLDQQPMQQAQMQVSQQIQSSYLDKTIPQQQVSNYNPNTPINNYYSNSSGAENIRIADDELIAREPETLSDIMKNRTVMLLMIMAALIGAVASYLFASTYSNSSGYGLDGIVLNPDVPAGRNRCGLVEKRQGCVLYIMNPKNIEVTAKDFYPTAAKWTERERYLVETGNMHYANERIRPGYIAQINIPPLSY